MKHTVTAIALLAFACGAESDIVTDDLGTAEQAVFAPRGPTYVLGSSTSQSATRCTTGSASQVCHVPMTKTYKFCSVGLTATENADLSALAQGGSNQTSPFRFSMTELTSGGSPVRDAACTTAFNAGTANVLVNASDNICGAAGAPATNIDSLVCANPSETTGVLPEVPSVPGSFKGIAGGVIHIDRARLAAAFPVLAQRQQVRSHGLGHQGARLIGLGARTEDPFTTFMWTRRQVQPLTAFTRTKSVGEECVTNFYSATGGVNYTTDAVSCTGGAGLPE